MTCTNFFKYKIPEEIAPWRLTFHHIGLCCWFFPSKLEWDRIPTDPVKSKLRDRAIRYSGFFGVREKWVRSLEISWSFLFSLKGPKFGPIDKVIFSGRLLIFWLPPKNTGLSPRGTRKILSEDGWGVQWHPKNNYLNVFFEVMLLSKYFLSQ